MQMDTLFILAAPFEDGGQQWFCRDCATIEGALLANPHWAKHVDVKRIAFARPRADVIALLGEDKQGVPALVLAENSEAPARAKRHDGRAYIKEPSAILDYLARTYGGAGVHP